MSVDLNPTSTIAQKFAEDLKISGKSPRTQQSYCRALRKFSEYLGHSPQEATEQQFRNYLLFIVQEKAWQASTVNVAQQALKLFYRITCPRKWKSLDLARVQVEQKLPVVLSVEEVHTLLKLIEKPAMRCFFGTVYALGLRLQEALHLQVSDIDSHRMIVHVHRGKGAKDRLIPLPEVTLTQLRQYWATHRNPLWIFPAEGRCGKQASKANKPISESSVQVVIKTVLHRLNWNNRGISTHTLRHSRFMNRRSKQSNVRLKMLVPITLNLVYTLTVAPEPAPWHRPQPAYPVCQSPMECLGFDRQAMTKLKLILTAEQLDTKRALDSG
jgi:site-specific recombinase XerD